MLIDVEPLTDDDFELIELARRTVYENTDGALGIQAMGAAVRAADGWMFAGINLTTSPADRVQSSSLLATPGPAAPGI